MVHDWTRVEAGIFHHFHTAWITHLTEALNGGVLPDGYYALGEQRAGAGHAPGALTLRVGEAPPLAGPQAIALVECPPEVSLTIEAEHDAGYRGLRRTLVIRHVSQHQVIALIEIVSRANKDRPAHVDELVDKIVGAVQQGIHVMVLDLFPPGKHDPQGIHGAVWDVFSGIEHQQPPHRPLTLASYAAAGRPRAYVQPLRAGDRLPEMPLSLEPAWYVNVPLQPTYDQAFSGMPAFWREVVEAAPAS